MAGHVLQVLLGLAWMAGPAGADDPQYAWVPYPDTLFEGFAAGDSKSYPLAAAQARCIALPSCLSITCTNSATTSCTVRASKTPVTLFAQGMYSMIKVLAVPADDTTTVPPTTLTTTAATGAAVPVGQCGQVLLKDLKAFEARVGKPLHRCQAPQKDIPVRTRTTTTRNAPSTSPPFSPSPSYAPSPPSPSYVPSPSYSPSMSWPPSPSYGGPSPSYMPLPTPSPSDLPPSWMPWPDPTPSPSFLPDPAPAPTPSYWDTPSPAYDSGSTPTPSDSGSAPSPSASDLIGGE